MLLLFPRPGFCPCIKWHTFFSFLFYFLNNTFPFVYNIFCLSGDEWNKNKLIGNMPPKAHCVHFLTGARATQPVDRSFLIMIQCDTMGYRLLTIPNGLARCRRLAPGLDGDAAFRNGGAEWRCTPPAGTAGKVDTSGLEGNDDGRIVTRGDDDALAVFSSI